MFRVKPWLTVCLLPLLVAGCQGGSSPIEISEPEPDRPGDPAPAPPVGDALAGLAAFTNVCAACHTSRDGFDLAFFGFSDTTIVRRAVVHVDTATARNIVAHVRSLDVIPFTRERRIFQPRGSVLSSDLDFAIALFGSDAWPAALTTADLRAIDPLQVSAALALPLWSIEFSNLDWMPETPPADAILDFKNAAARTALSRYYREPTLPNVTSVVSALRSADRNPDNPAAPCVTDQMERFDARSCFELRRWTSTLVAQHMLRNGLEDALNPVLHDVWWDVGNAARHAEVGAIENRDLNWASWMYLGWIFEPGRHASTYLGNGLTRLGLSRHATFVALRAQVSRASGSRDPYADVTTAARLAPETWTLAATSFGYRHLLERLAAGDRPREEDKAEAVMSLQKAYDAASRKISPQERVALAELRDQVLNALN